MKNINRDYLVTVNAKNSTVTANAMSFYITDVLTSNIFFQLVFNESSNLLINSFAPNEDASNYALTLRVVKPNNEPKELNVTRLDQDSNFFIADLQSDYIDLLGTYECELFIDTTINGRAERSTTNSFTYTVKPSIFSKLDDIIESNPDFPLIDTLATKDYVDKAVAAGVDIDNLTTAITVNGNTYNPVDGVITLPDYPTGSSGSGNNNIWTGTINQFNAIDTKDPNTIYFIYGIKSNPTDNDIFGLYKVMTYTYNIPESGELVVPDLIKVIFGSQEITDYTVIKEADDGQKMRVSIYAEELPLSIMAHEYRECYTSIDYINYENITILDHAFDNCTNLEYVNFNTFGTYESDVGVPSFWKCPSLNRIMAVFCYENTVIEIASHLPEREQNDGIIYINKQVNISNLPVVKGWTYSNGD